MLDEWHGLYKLRFISDNDLFEHVKTTVQQYSFTMDLKEFNRNIIDPIKLTFDMAIYNKSIADIIGSEVIRQIDKSNNNTIGYFHQNIFKYIGGNEWIVLPTGFDIVNDNKKIYVEMKNKHNTMNANSSQRAYIKMSAKLQQEANATCMLVEVIAKKSQNIPWCIKIDGEKFASDQIRRVSIDKFYEIVTGQSDSFKQLCLVLPKVIKDVVNSIATEEVFKNTVNIELSAISGDTLTSLYLLAFNKYEGFSDFLLDDQ